MRSYILNIYTLGEFEIEFQFNLNWIWNWIWVKFNEIERFLKYLWKYLGSPCYLIVVSGGSFLLGGLNKDTRRCFLQCLQASSILSLLFNIELWSAVRITSFSVMHRLHEQPPLENGWLLLNQYSSVSPLSNGVSDLAW